MSLWGCLTNWNLNQSVSDTGTQTPIQTHGHGLKVYETPANFENIVIM